MEKISKTLSADYLAIKIYQEDLEAIEVTLKAGAKSFQLTTDDYKFDSVAEFLSHYKNQSLKELDIFVAYLSGEYAIKYISIHFKKTYASLTCTSEDPTIVGAFYRTKEILSAAARKPRILYSMGVLLILLLVLDVSAFVFPRYAPFWIVLQSINLFWYSWAMYIRLWKSSDIVVDKRALAENFLERNKDSLVINLLVIIITFILTVFGTVYIQQIKNFLHIK